MHRRRKTIGLLAFAVIVVAIVAVWRATRTASEPEATPKRSTPALGADARDEAAANRAIPAAAVAAPAAASAAETDPAKSDAAAPEDERELRGRVIDPAGLPVAGASVEVRRRALEGANDLDVDLDPERLGTLVASASTAEDGAFAFTLPRARAHDLHVRAAGFASEVIASRFASQFVLVQLHLGATVSGTVTRTEEGTPIAGAASKIWPSDPPFVPERRGATDAEGRYEFVDLPPGSYRMEISPTGGAVASPWVTVTLEAGQSLVQDFALERGFPVSGRVSNAVTGEAIAGAEVGEGWMFHRPIRTDAEGKYVFEGLGNRGVADLHARADGYGRKAWTRFGAVSGALVVDFALEPARRAFGRVVDSRGQPVADAYVAVFGSVMEGQDQKTDWLGTKSGPDGTFTVASVRPDIPHAVFVRKDGHGTVVRDFPPDEMDSWSIDLGDIRLAPEAILLGIVEDENGIGLSGVEITLTFSDTASRRRTGYGDTLETRSDDAGRFRFSGLPAGGYRIRAFQRHRVGGEETVIDGTISDGEVKDGVHIVLASGLEITGSVVDPEGSPVSSVVVLLRSSASIQGPRPSGSVITDAMGAFRFTGLEPGAKYRISTMMRMSTGQPEGRRLSVASVSDVEAGTLDLRVVMPFAASLSGTVLEANGRPSPKAFVFATSAEGEQLDSDLSDDAGAFSLDVPEGAVVDVQAMPSNPDVTSPWGVSPVKELKATVSGVAAGSRKVVIELPPR